MVESCLHHYSSLLRRVKARMEKYWEGLSDRIPCLKGLINLKLPELKSGDIRYVSEGILHILIAAYIFYENLYMAVLLIPYIIMHVKECRKIAENRRKTAMAQEFKDGIMAVSFALNVGYSIENSFVEAVNELILLYGENSDIVRRFFINSKTGVRFDNCVNKE